MFFRESKEIWKEKLVNNIKRVYRRDTCQDIVEASHDIVAVSKLNENFYIEREKIMTNVTGK